MMAFALATGCADSGPRRQFGAEWRQSPLSAMEAQSALMSLSDKVMFTIADACERVAGSTTSSQARLRCASIRLGTGLGALAAATGPNPYIGAVDLVTLVTLQRMWLEEASADGVLDEADRQTLLSAFVTVEQEVWSQVGRVLTRQQCQELRTMIAEWRAANPDRRDLSWVRLQEFATSRQSGASGQGAAPPNSILSLLWIDPAANLAPATREIQESRLLAERLAFFGKRTPVILGWQIELTTARLLDTREVQQLMANSSHMTDSLSDFTASAERLAASYERTLDELPKERAAAVEQIETATGRQVTAFIEQSSAALTTVRAASVEQLGEQFSGGLQSTAAQLAADLDRQTAQTLDRMAEILAQQEKTLSASLSAHLAEADAASQRLVDRIALRLLMVIVAGALAIAVIALAYRAVTGRFGVARP